MPLIFSLFTFTLYSIEVEGHITEDTTWSPDNNPYYVIDDVFVDDNVTLTILPGTEVKFHSTRLICYDDFSNFIYYNGTNIAKMLWVDGKIKAEGTEEDPITFTRAQDSLYYHWGVIYLTEFANRCVFKYCNFEYSARMMILVGILPVGAISIHNEETIIENCNFVDNFCGVFMQFFPQKVIVKNNYFFNIENIHPSLVGYADGGIRIGAGVSVQLNPILIAGNIFNQPLIPDFDLSVISAPVYVVDNQFIDDEGEMSACNACMDADAASYFYRNDFIGFHYYGIRGGRPTDSLYIKKNNFIGGYDGISINHAYVEISDNYFEGCDLDTDCNTSGLIYNNKINNGSAYGPGIVDYFNNISYNHENGIGICATYLRLSCTNNISVNNQYAFEASESFDNCIFFGNEELEQFGVTGTPIFRNCIIDFPLEPPLIDGGGNIIVDSLQAQTLFEDIQNGDFHLIEGSLAIDAGFDTLGYYYPFDMDYNHRVWDGDGNGSAIIDIGPYEYNSPSFGGIEGYTYNPTTGDPVDYVLLKIDNQPGEFTFSDSLGNFQFKLPAGTYDVYAERVFYEDIIQYEIEVFDGQFTQIAISMIEIVDVKENTIPHSSNIISNLRNYPNPFNPETTIEFSIKLDSKVELSIYNIKGQKVRTLHPFPNPDLSGGTRSVIWNGKDSNNKSVASGIYFYKIKVGDFQKVRKMILLR
ncbi:MAG: T9SS type A sorting domain-containing protein [Candidatus Cloacimonetes bacterium]|nr:T9SS type A sorting domain-containing protein [Candidatus Cloacimonadota bacterium]